MQWVSRSPFRACGWFPLLSLVLAGGCMEDAWELPGFEVKLELTPEARDELGASNETILVWLMYYGSKRKPWDTSTGVPVVADEKLEFGLSDDVKVVPDRTVKVPSGNESRGLLINVISGRTSSELNLLSCDVYSTETLADVAGQTIDIGCRLIGSDPAE